MGISRPKNSSLFGPKSVEGGLVGQNKSRGPIERSVGITKKSLRSATRETIIEEVRTELREGYAFSEEKRRELDFLDKGGDPLDFKFGNYVSPTVLAWMRE
ncbi:hypothetical protein CQW23_23265 [Capsicum baccatum]|uniref:Uncharacterized protein n=1 Tax=Capsicum baccatum TaxID=33114 RepID=A0A2G2VRG4_CAPBA|nr:hypothetical protein CQW23_23265 [Capsicum baccatum]